MNVWRLIDVQLPNPTVSSDKSHYLKCFFWGGDNHQPDSHGKKSNPMHDATELWSIDMFGKLSMLVRFKLWGLLIFVYQFLVWAYRTVLMCDIFVEHPVFGWYKPQFLWLLVGYSCCWCSTALHQSNWDVQYVWQSSNQPFAVFSGFYPTKKRHLSRRIQLLPLAVTVPVLPPNPRQGLLESVLCPGQVAKTQAGIGRGIWMGWAVGVVNTSWRRSPIKKTVQHAGPTCGCVI